MGHNVFEHPVTVFVGLGFPTQIASVKEAYAFLCEWPPSKRNAAHKIALNACKGALAGEIDADTARGMFMAFVRKNGLLAAQAHDVPTGTRAPAFGSAADRDSSFCYTASGGRR